MMAMDVRNPKRNPTRLLLGLTERMFRVPFPQSTPDAHAVESFR
jgi:hypothetical protein